MKASDRHVYCHRTDWCSVGPRPIRTKKTEQGEQWWEKKTLYYCIICVVFQEAQEQLSSLFSLPLQAWGWAVKPFQRPYAPVKLL